MPNTATLTKKKREGFLQSLKACYFLRSVGSFNSKVITIPKHGENYAELSRIIRLFYDITSVRHVCMVHCLFFYKKTQQNYFGASVSLKKFIDGAIFSLCDKEVLHNFVHLSNAILMRKKNSSQSVTPHTCGNICCTWCTQLWSDGSASSLTLIPSKSTFNM